MKLIKSYIVLILICIVGFFLFMYPIISNHWNSKHSSKVIVEYDDYVQKYDAEESKKIIEEVNLYNLSLLERENEFKLSKEQQEKYNSLLNIDNLGNIGYISIKKINVNIPIYHGISDEVLVNNVGHLEWSSLPIGGESTHAVLSAHNGLITSRLFTDLRKLNEGDTFVIHVLNEELIYEVDQIRTVKPDDNSYLKIEKGKDLVTLITCTPYGINTDRLLVRGHRIIDNKEYSNFAPNGYLINKYIEAGLLSIIPVCLFIIIILINKKTKKEKSVL